MQQYGKLIGPCGVHKYEIELIPRDVDANDQQQEQEQEQEQEQDEQLNLFTPPPSSLPVQSAADDSWTSPKTSTPRSKAKQTAKAANLPKIVCCTLDELEICSEDSPPSQQQGGKQAGTVPNPARPAKPKSTVGIDIDTWQPFVTHDFLTQYQEEQQRQQEPQEENSPGLADINSDGPLPEANDSIVFASGYYKNLEMMGSDDDDECSPSSAAAKSGNHGKKQKGRQLKHSGTGTAGWGRKGHKRKQTGKESPRSPLAPAPDLVLSIWDFAGQEIYHAAQEAFFSERALYLVVWDMTKNTEEDMDRYVQFWIDLIQSRAPGSTIIVVATHEDELMKKRKRKPKPWASRRSPVRQGANKSSVKELAWQDPFQWHTKPLCKHLHKHLKCREEARKVSIEKDLHEAEKNKDVEQAAQLRYLSENRPFICPVFPVSCTTMRGFKSLTAKIISLSKPTKKNKNPFQLVDIYIPRFYLKVKEEIEHMRRAESHIVTMAQLQDHLSHAENAASFEDDSLAQKLSQHSINDVRDAISFLSSIGEVVWFQPLSADGSHNQKSDFKSDFDTKSDIFSAQSDHVNTLSNTLPQRRRGSAGSGGTTHSGDEDVWREVEDLEAHLNHNGDISDMVFLSPHWLIDVLKRVLTHHLIDTVRHLTTSMSQNDLSRYFGENPLEHAKNGIVRWTLIEEKLMHIQINSPTSTSTGREKKGSAFKKNIIHSLR